MRFIRFRSDIYNVDYIIRVWEERLVCSDGTTEYWKTHITSHNGAENLTDITYRGQHAEETWELLTKVAPNSPAPATIGRNVLVDEVLNT